MRDAILDAMHDRLSAVLDDAKDVFKPGSRALLVIINPDIPNSEVIIGDADPAAVVEAIQKMTPQTPVRPR